MTAQIGDILGNRYQLLSIIGKGGMGIVFRALDRLTNTVVALKQVLTSANPNDDATKPNFSDQSFMLAQEFRLLSTLRHPNIISVLDYGFDAQGTPFYTMELLENPITILDDGRDQTLERQLSLIVQLIQAVAYLHRRHVIHRDLKPENVMIVNGQVKVLDFGLSSHRTIRRGIAGTLAYMAPELLQDSAPSTASDLYAVGVLAYEVLTGSFPFRSHDITLLVQDILQNPPDLTPLSPPLQALVGRLLEKDPNSRFQDANELLKAFIEVTDYPYPTETIATRDSFLRASELVGREHELEQLTNALQRADMGTGSVVLVAGESGVGKSRLLDELATVALVSGALVLRGHGLAEMSLPYYLWRDILRRLVLITDLSDFEAGVLKAIAFDIEQLLGRKIDDVPELDPTASTSRLLSVIEGIFQRQHQLILVIVEDLQWTRESLDVLIRLSRSAPSCRLLLVGSYRDDENPTLAQSLPTAQVIKLPRLTLDQIAKLSEMMLGNIGGNEQVKELLQRETEGNVFFIIEMVRALAEDAGELDQVGSVTKPAHVVVGSINSIVQRRLSRVPTYAKELLCIASLMGRQLNLEVLAHVRPEIDLQRWLSDCALVAVLDIYDNVWRFTHDKLREGLVDALQPEEFIRLNEEIALAMESLYTQVAEQAVHLARYWDNALNNEKAIYYLKLAGEQSLRMSGFRDARLRFEKALMLVNYHPSADVTTKLYLMQGLASAFKGMGAYPEAQQQYEEVLSVAVEIGDLVAVTSALNNLGVIARRQGQYVDAHRFFHQSLDLALKIRNRYETALALNNLGILARKQGDFTTARQYYRESLTLWSELGDLQGVARNYNNLGTSDEKQGDLSSAVINLQSGLEIARKIGDLWAVSALTDSLGNVAQKQGRYDEAHDWFEQSHAIALEITDKWLEISALNSMGSVDNLRGRHEEALTHFLMALRFAVNTEATPDILESLIGIGSYLAYANNPKLSAELYLFVIHHASYNEDVREEAIPLQHRLQNALQIERLDTQPSVLDDWHVYDLARQILLDAEAISSRVTYTRSTT